MWFEYYKNLPKLHRYSLGQKIDGLFVEIMEAVAVASFLPKEEKLPWLKLAIRKTDTQKVLMMILWETKSLDTKKYIAISIKIEEVGKNLWGWNGQIKKSLDNI